MLEGMQRKNGCLGVRAGGCGDDGEGAASRRRLLPLLLGPLPLRGVVDGELSDKEIGADNGRARGVKLEKRLPRLGGVEPLDGIPATWHAHSVVG